MTEYQKHTPGPWFSCNNHVDDHKGITLFKSTRDFEKLNPLDFHLTAAAPELLAACKTTLGFLETQLDSEDSRAIRDQLYAAIRKVTAGVIKTKTHKVCPRCGSVKPVGQFPPRGKCKACRKVPSRVKSQKDKDEILKELIKEQDLSLLSTFLQRLIGKLGGVKECIAWLQSESQYKLGSDRSFMVISTLNRLATVYAANRHSTSKTEKPENNLEK